MEVLKEAGINHTTYECSISCSLLAAPLYAQWGRMAAVAPVHLSLCSCSAQNCSPGEDTSWRQQSRNILLSLEQPLLSSEDGAGWSGVLS